jgi:hypothetical protein
MRVTLRSITHLVQWADSVVLVTSCRRRLVVPKCNKNTGTFWCRSEETTIIVDYDKPVDCMTCLVLEAR